MAQLTFYEGTSYNHILPVFVEKMMSDSTFLKESFTVISPNVSYTDSTITSKYTYQSAEVVGTNVRVINKDMVFKTDRKVGKVGLMLVGWGGNNGSTATAALLANKMGISWMTKEGKVNSNYFGSLTQASTVRLGHNSNGESVYIPFKNMLPMVDPNDLVIGGWDISSMNLADAMQRGKVLDYDLQRQMVPHLENLRPLPSIYHSDFIASNQFDRADNLIKGNKAFQLETIRKDIRDFKLNNGLDKVTDHFAFSPKLQSIIISLKVYTTTTLSTKC